MLFLEAAAVPVLVVLEYAHTCLFFVVFFFYLDGTKVNDHKIPRFIIAAVPQAGTSILAHLFYGASRNIQEAP